MKMWFEWGVPMDEGVHMDTMLQHLGQSPFMAEQQLAQQPIKKVPMDEDAHMETLPQCVNQPPTMDGPQPTQQKPRDHPMEQHDMAGTQIV